MIKEAMATVCSFSRPNFLLLQPRKTISPFPVRNVLPHLQCHVNMFTQLNIREERVKTILCCSVSEQEETPIVPAEDETTEQVSVPVDDEQETVSEQPVSVPVSPSDLLTMFFQADGTMSEAVIPTVTSALQEIEGISNLKVQVVEGIASVELTKQTTIQATGVASNLVEIIQGSGFKLQTLNLSFEDEEEALVA